MVELNFCSQGQYSLNAIFLYKYTQLIYSDIYIKIKRIHSCGLPLSGSYHCRVFYVFSARWRQNTEHVCAYLRIIALVSDVPSQGNNGSRLNLRTYLNGQDRRKRCREVTGGLSSSSTQDHKIKKKKKKKRTKTLCILGIVVAGRPALEGGVEARAGSRWVCVEGVT